MSEKIQQTQAMLAKHHRDGEAFVQTMKDTHAGRFNDDFWAVWAERVEPILSAQPLILDLGTGPALFLREVAQRHPHIRAIGVECAEYMLNATKDLPDNCEIIEADLHDPHLPLADASVDAAVASVVLHEMHQPVRALQEVQRCLKPGGIFYVLDWVRAPLAQYLQNTELAVFDRQTKVDELEDLFIHFIEHNRFSIDDLAFMLENTGFRVVEKTALKNGQMARLVAEKIAV
ncbi:MAG: methyltransferase domain-containing protein [Gammaproteobacteria bacterium]|nr:methyltransferase domain-containing protein [Gammaproteobacteria bacterium]